MDMSHVDWVQARYLYCVSESVSYDMLAKQYKVAKSTITRRAAREHWPQLRREYQDDKFKQLLKSAATSQNEVEMRHLKTIRIAIAALHNTIVEIATKTANGTATHKDTHQLSAATTALFKSIMEERIILRLPTEPVRLKSEEAIDEYKTMMGLVEPPVDDSYKKTKQAIESLDRMIERKQMLESMRYEVDKRGSF